MGHLKLMHADFTFNEMKGSYMYTQTVSLHYRHSKFHKLQRFEMDGETSVIFKTFGNLLKNPRAT